MQPCRLMEFVQHCLQAWVWAVAVGSRMVKMAKMFQVIALTKVFVITRAQILRLPTRSAKMLPTMEEITPDVVVMDVDPVAEQELVIT